MLGMKSTVLLLLIGSAFALQTPTEPSRHPLAIQSPVQDKNFYFLSLLERTAAARDAIEKDVLLTRISTERWERIEQARNCNSELDCSTMAFHWSEEQISRSADAMADLYKTSPAIQDVTEFALRASGMYVRYESLNGGDLLKIAWADSIRRINRAIEIYGEGKSGTPKQRYAEIDSMLRITKCDGQADPVEWVKCDEWRFAVQNLANLLYDDRENLRLPFSPSLRFAVELLVMNQRDEAGRFEPLELGENAAAVRRLKSNSIDWNKYPYSAIVVPGRGPDVSELRLSPLGRVRDEIAARRFLDGKAPFLLVSGGYVHPNQTPFCEAIEMKHDLMTRFHIPEDAIIVDPHARHTTTNMRNAARLIYRYGIPFDKLALVTTDPMQSRDIESQAFADRCTKELGVVPFQIEGRISPSDLFDLKFRPSILALEIDPTDLLDP